MQCGLFGKLPAKRDFVALGAPRAFLRVFEPWLEAGLRQGRAASSAENWTAAFNSAPIWRFWLGPALCGEAFTGAFMPSVDALGRMFPLTLVASSSGAPLQPPDLDPRDAWFADVENLLLDALDPNAAFDGILARLDGLCAERPADHDSPSTAIFAAMRREQADCPADSATFWWTIGGANWPPLALMQKDMPTPAAFADMMSRSQSRRQDANAENRAQAVAQSG